MPSTNSRHPLIHHLMSNRSFLQEVQAPPRQRNLREDRVHHFRNQILLDQQCLVLPQRICWGRQVANQLANIPGRASVHQPSDSSSEDMPGCHTRRSYRTGGLIGNSRSTWATARLVHLLSFLIPALCIRMLWVPVCFLMLL